MNRFSQFCAIVVASLVIGQTGAWGSTPGEQIKEAIHHVREVLNGPPGRTENERRESVRKALLPQFDFAEMAKRSLGPHWRKEPDRQQEFIAVFTDFVENAYVDKILNLEEEKVVFVDESVDQEIALVKTKIIPRTGEPFAVNYKLHNVGGSWKIYDVVVENISLVNNYRSQFHRVITRESFDELIRLLKQKGGRSDS